MKYITCIATDNVSITGINATIKRYIGIFIIIAIDAIAAPKANEPVSPINTFAGFTLNIKNPNVEPTVAAPRTTIGVSPFFTATSVKNVITIATTPEHKPSSPSVKFTALLVPNNTSSVNTTRMVSIMNKKGEVEILTTFLRIGNGKCVDNFNSGGMTAKVDIETGTVLEEAVNKAGELFEKHPLTGTIIKGFQIPYWNEAKELVKKAARESTHVRYVGWDVGMSVNGPVLIEGNQFPGHDIYQVAEKIGPDDIGILPRIQEILKEK